ncbi:hypothetical protein [Mediterraneibacter glycyrrhizinilyticus]|uniref:hypothetical protein n=1 Tax=Mediterraneibacter glycyrrhizinilyticus TaxID=342942 RepID=UPI00189E3AD7|nr:hypothetical protein [Mediterraneibacter glycyrrhizinilyticus]
MGKKDRCYLCGAKLQNGYCKECGLDNRRSQKIRYRLNESNATKKNDSFEEMAEEQRETETRNIQKYKAAQQRAWSKTGGAGQWKKAGTRQTMQKGTAGGGFRLERALNFEKKKNMNGEKGISRKTAAFMIGGIGFVVLMIALMYSAMEADLSYYGETNMTVEYSEESGSGFSEPEESGELVALEDPHSYEFVSRELDESGDTYIEELEYGEYIVGSQIPEGIYTIRLKEGSGYVNVDDAENTIYLWQDFGTDTKYDELLEWQDVRLYEGAIVEISDNVTLEFSSENAQTSDLKMKENPNVEECAFSLETEDKIVAGKDFEPGVYDVSIPEWNGWGVLYLKVKTTDPYDEDGYYETSIWLDGGESGKTYHNLYLSDGAEIYIEGDPAEFVPSEKIADIDYKEYYEKYH